jgi:hypothetical protein
MITSQEFPGYARAEIRWCSTKAYWPGRRPCAGLPQRGWRSLRAPLRVRSRWGGWDSRVTDVGVSTVWLRWSDLTEQQDVRGTTPLTRSNSAEASGANEIGEPNGEPTSADARPHTMRQRAIVSAARSPIGPHPATCSDAADAPEKRKVGGSDVAPERGALWLAADRWCSKSW